MRIGIGPSTFAQEDKTPLELLQEAGITVVPNSTGKRLTEPEITQFLVGEKLDGSMTFWPGLNP